MWDESLSRALFVIDGVGSTGILACAGLGFLIEGKAKRATAHSQEWLCYVSVLLSGESQ